MGYLDLRLAHGQGAVEKQVEIDYARSEAWAGAAPTELALDQLKAREQLPRRQIGLDDRGAVQKKRLVE